MKISKKITDKSLKVGVIGLGYVGLPLILRLVEQNVECIGFDIDETKVNKLNEGVSYIEPHKL